MTDVDAVLFDLDDTLVRYRRPTGEVLGEAYEALDLDPLFPVEAYFERFDRYVGEHDTIRELRRACFAVVAADRGYDPELGRAVADAFCDRRDQSAVELLPGAERVLDRLADRPLGVVTNGMPDVQEPKLRASGVGDRVDTVVFAGYDTAAKPAAEPFHRALAALDVDPSRAVHVGNSLTSDVAGAHAAGLRSVWVPTYEEESEVTPDYRLDSLAELLDQSWLRWGP